MGAKAASSRQPHLTSTEACLEATRRGFRLNRERLIRLCQEGRIVAVPDERGRYLIDPASLNAFLRQEATPVAAGQ